MSGESLPMMPWFPRDFIAATRAMSLAERGAYRDLLDFQWDMGKLPAAHDRLARLLGVTLDEFEAVWPAIADKFVERDGHIYNQRVDRDRKDALEARAAKVRGALRTNAKRYGDRSGSDSDSDSPSDTGSGRSPTPTPTPTPNRKTEEKNAVTSVPSDELRGQPKAGARAAPTAIPDDWQPNAVNMGWLTGAGCSIAQIKGIVEEFVRWAKNSERLQANWQLAFSRNPGVKNTLGRIKSGQGGKGHGERLSAVEQVQRATGVRI